MAQDRNGATRGGKLWSRTLRTTLLIVCATNVWRARAQAADHTSEIKAYAFASIAAFTAETQCDGMKIDKGKLIWIRAIDLHMTDADDSALAAEYDRLKPVMQRTILKDGAPSWCRGVLGLFGPRGSVVPGLLRR